MNGILQLYIVEEMGQTYLEPPQFNLEESYNDSYNCSPLIFILSAGSDPMAGLVRFASDKGISKSSLMTISLGQGQVLTIAILIKRKCCCFFKGTNSLKYDQYGFNNRAMGGVAKLPLGRELDAGIGQDLRRGHCAGNDAS